MPNIFFLQGVEISEVVNSGPGLVFITYPEVVLKLPGGPVWAITFFVMLVVSSFFVLLQKLVFGGQKIMPSLSLETIGRKYKEEKIGKCSEEKKSSTLRAVTGIPKFKGCSSLHPKFMNKAAAKAKSSCELLCIFQKALQIKGPFWPSS